MLLKLVEMYPLSCWYIYVDRYLLVNTCTARLLPLSCATLFNTTIHMGLMVPLPSSIEAVDFIVQESKAARFGMYMGYTARTIALNSASYQSNQGSQAYQYHISPYSTVSLAEQFVKRYTRTMISLCS